LSQPKQPLSDTDAMPTMSEAKLRDTGKATARIMGSAGTLDISANLTDRPNEHHELHSGAASQPRRHKTSVDLAAMAVVQHERTVDEKHTNAEPQHKEMSVGSTEAETVSHDDCQGSQDSVDQACRAGDTPAGSTNANPSAETSPLEGIDKPTAKKSTPTMIGRLATNLFRRGPTNELAEGEALEERESRLERCEKEFAAQVAETRRKLNEEATQREAEASQREAEARQREAEVIKREAEANQREAEVIKREAEANQREAEISKREADANQREAEISKREAEIIKRALDVDAIFAALEKTRIATQESALTAGNKPYTAAYHVQSGTTASKFQAVIDGVRGYSGLSPELFVCGEMHCTYPLVCLFVKPSGPRLSEGVIKFEEVELCRKMVQPGGSLLVCTMRAGNDPQAVKDLPPGCPQVEALLDFCYLSGNAQRPHTINETSNMNCRSASTLADIVRAVVPSMPPRKEKHTSMFNWLAQPHSPWLTHAF